MVKLNAANLNLKFLKLLLHGLVFLRHLLVLGFPLVTLSLEGLHLALKVAGLDIRDTKSIEQEQGSAEIFQKPGR